VAGAAAGAVGLDGAIIVESRGAPVDLPGDAPAGLTLEQVIRAALANDPRIQMALAKVRIAQAEAHQARLLPNPIFTVEVRFREKGGTPIVAPALAQDFVAFLKRPREIGAADKRLAAAGAEALVVVLDVLTEAQESYLAAQSLDEELAILEQRRKVIDKLLELSQARLNSGEGTRLDVTTLQGKRIELEIDLADRRQERADERLILARLLGRPSGSIEWMVAPWRPVEGVRGAESAWLAAGLVHRPEMQAKQWELAALGDEAALTRFAKWEGSDGGIHAELDGDWSLGPAVTIPIPLFDFGQAKEARATAQQTEARHGLTLTARQVIEDVRRAYSAYAASVATLRKARNELLPLQEQRYALAQASYRAGEADLVTLLMAEEELQDTREKVVASQKKSVASLIKLHRAVGGTGVAGRVAATQPARP
jgi:outer membrane protein TolC